VPSTRILALSSTASGSLSTSSGRSVSSCSTISGENVRTAVTRASLSKTSQTIGCAPIAASRAALPADLVIAPTVWPALTSNGTSRLPMTPEAPAR
jgi:hypothetical protein